MHIANFLKSFTTWLIVTTIFVSMSVFKNDAVNLTPIKYLAIGGLIITISISLLITITLIRYLINTMVFSKHYSSSWTRTLSDVIYISLFIFVLKFEKVFTVNETIEIIMSLLLVTMPLVYFIIIVLIEKIALKDKIKTRLIAWCALSVSLNYFLLVLPILAAALGTYLYTKILY